MTTCKEATESRPTLLSSFGRLLTTLVTTSRVSSSSESSDSEEESDPRVNRNNGNPITSNDAALEATCSTSTPTNVAQPSRRSPPPRPPPPRAPPPRPPPPRPPSPTSQTTRSPTVETTTESPATATTATAETTRTKTIPFCSSVNQPTEEREQTHEKAPPDAGAESLYSLAVSPSSVSQSSGRSGTGRQLSAGRWSRGRRGGIGSRTRRLPTHNPAQSLTSSYPSAPQLSLSPKAGSTSCESIFSRTSECRSFRVPSRNSIYSTASKVLAAGRSPPSKRTILYDVTSFL